MYSEMLATVSPLWKGVELVAKYQRRNQKRLAARHKDIPSTGYYPIGVKTGFFRKAGSENRKK
jgi:hypothetical protein